MPHSGFVLQIRREDSQKPEISGEILMTETRDLTIIGPPAEIDDDDRIASIMVACLSGRIYMEATHGAGGVRPCLFTTDLICNLPYGIIIIT